MSKLEKYLIHDHLVAYLVFMLDRTCMYLLIAFIYTILYRKERERNRARVREKNRNLLVYYNRFLRFFFFPPLNGTSFFRRFINGLLIEEKFRLKKKLDLSGIKKSVRPKNCLMFLSASKTYLRLLSSPDRSSLLLR